MRVDQITPAIRDGEDISKAVLVLQKIIGDLGCETEIFTETRPKEPRAKVLELSSLGNERENIIYHMYMGSQISKTLVDLKAKRKVLFYHGIIPPEYFENHPARIHLLNGYEELKTLRDQFAVAITTTKFHERELQKAGYGQTMVLPLLVDLNEYDQEPDSHLMNEYDDNFTNILFVGRITPNKKLEDTILVFNYYHKKLNPKSRLFLVGSFSDHASYCQKLLTLIKELEIKNVFLTGRVSFKKLLAYYRLSKVFLCMSEYKGFSTPLIEAMYLKVPVIAFARSAVPEVLGGAGYLIDDKNVRETAKLLDRIVIDQAEREEIISRQWERVTAFSPERVFPLYRKAIMEAFGYKTPEDSSKKIGSSHRHAFFTPLAGPVFPDYGNGGLSALMQIRKGWRR